MNLEHGALGGYSEHVAELLLAGDDLVEGRHSCS
jgi:hypothetical protein